MAQERTASRTLAHDHALAAAELLDMAEAIAPTLRPVYATQATAHATLALFYQREAELEQPPRIIYPGALPDDPTLGLPTEREG